MKFKTAHKKDTLLTHQEVMEVLKVSRFALHGMRKRGEIKGIKVGKYLRFKQSEIDKVLHG
jgi:excisionase family DNA binding protein